LLIALFPVGQLKSLTEHRAIGNQQSKIKNFAMLFMVIEHFKNGDALPVYKRFREQGRMMPDGLQYLASWTTRDFERCFQLMECDDAELLEQWMAHWRDLVDFEVVQVISSAEAVAAISDRV
jgi:hypothetical protein